MALRVPPNATFERVLLRLGGVRGVNAVAPGNLHYTLRFVGEVAGDVFQRLAAAVEGTPFGAPFDVTVQATGAFPDARRPRVVWAGCDAAAAPHLTRLAAAADRLAEAAGLGPRDKAFVPHLTLARVKRLEGRGGAEVGRILAEEQGTVYGTFRAVGVALVESTLGPGGPRYEDVAEVPLR